MNNLPKYNVSIIVPAFNAEKNLERCINSLLKQTYTNFKLIIVNDGSTDRTSDILSKITDPRVMIVNQKNQGVSVARNEGLRHVNTKYVGFVDSDDYVSTTYLEHLMEGYLSNNKIDLSISGINYIDSDKKSIFLYKTGKYSAKKIMSEILDNDGVKGYLWNKLWKVEIIRKNKLKLDPDLKMAEDLLFTVKYLKYVRNVYISNYKDYNYAFNVNSLSNSISLKNLNDNYKKSFSDYLKVSRRIVSLMPSDNVKGKNNAQANLAMVGTNYIRRLWKDNNGIEIDYKIRKECKKYTLYVIAKNTILTTQQKIAFILTIFLPAVMKSIDKIRR